MNTLQPQFEAIEEKTPGRVAILSFRRGDITLFVHLALPHKRVPLALDLDIFIDEKQRGLAAADPRLLAWLREETARIWLERNPGSRMETDWPPPRLSARRRPRSRSTRRRVSCQYCGGAAR